MKSSTNYRKYPELVKGIRVQFWDEGALRTERIHSRRGNTITVINAVKQKTRIDLERIRGWWKPKVKCKPENMISLEGKQLTNACKRQKRKEGLRQVDILKCTECPAKECRV